MCFSVEVPRLDLAAVAVNQLFLQEEVAEQILLGFDVLGNFLGNDFSVLYDSLTHNFAPFVNGDNAHLHKSLKKDM